MPGFHFKSKPRGYKPAHAIDVEPESPSCGSPENRRHGIFFHFGWGSELATTCASMALFGAIMSIFWKMDHKPLSAWLCPNIISLNAALSILSTACAGLLMHGVSHFIGQMKWLYFKREPRKLADLTKFDEASRGPWGSLKFFIGVKPNLATIGAFITLLRLCFSPMVQQVVNIGIQAVPNGTASFGYAHAYDRELTQPAIEESIPQDLGLQVAILRGLYNISSPAMSNCSAKCTWQGKYISLGFKTKCTNVTEPTLISSRCDKAYDNPSMTICNMTTPRGLHISTRSVATELATTYQMNVSSRWESADLEHEPLSKLPEVARFALYRSTWDFNFTTSYVNITDCSLSLTAYEYDGAQSDGAEFKFERSREVDLGPWTRRNFQSFETTASPAEGIPSVHVSPTDLTALKIYLESDAIVSDWVEGSWKNKNFGLSAALSGDVDIGKRFEMLALGMTNYIRSGPNSMQALGESYDLQLFVFINWKLVIAPAAIEVSAVLFAIITIIRNRKSRNVPLWKSSALAVLTCQYDDLSGKIQAKVTDIKEIEKMADKTYAQLQ